MLGIVFENHCLDLEIQECFRNENFDKREISRQPDCIILSRTIRGIRYVENSGHKPGHFFVLLGHCSFDFAIDLGA